MFSGTMRFRLRRARRRPPFSSPSPRRRGDISANLPMILLSTSGNRFGFPTRMRLLEVYIPERVAKDVQGPSTGARAFARSWACPTRTLVLQIVKPKMGMTPEETANQVHPSALGARWSILRWSVFHRRSRRRSPKGRNP